MNNCLKVIDKNGKIESYYLTCHNDNDKYQLVSIPWLRVDHREWDSEESAFENLKNIVAKRESTVEHVNNFSFYEKKLN